MLNPANGGASVGVWGRYPSALKIIMTESVNSTLICGSIFPKQFVDAEITAPRSK
jgi:hypothetical protein